MLAAQQQPPLAELLSIIDTLRTGDVRIRRVAGEELTKRLRSAPTSSARA